MPENRAAQALALVPPSPPPAHELAAPKACPALTRKWAAGPWGERREDVGEPQGKVPGARCWWWRRRPQRGLSSRPVLLLGAPALPAPDLPAGRSADARW